MEFKKCETEELKELMDFFLNTPPLEVETEELKELIDFFLNTPPLEVEFKEDFSDSSTVLYVFQEFKDAYFDTKDELAEYCKSHRSPFSSFYAIEYLKYFDDKKDVIKFVTKDEVKYFAVCDAETYYEYIVKENCKNIKWNCQEGSIADLYKPFRDRGIIFEDDIYKRVEEATEELYKVLQKAEKGIQL